MKCLMVDHISRISWKKPSFFWKWTWSVSVIEAFFNDKIKEAGQLHWGAWTWCKCFRCSTVLWSINQSIKWNIHMNYEVEYHKYFISSTLLSNLWRPPIKMCTDFFSKIKFSSNNQSRDLQDQFHLLNFITKYWIYFVINK